MKIEQRTWTADQGWTRQSTDGGALASAEVVFAFGTSVLLRDAALIETLRQFYPAAQIFGCSSSGEVSGARISDNSLTVCAVHFEHTLLRATTINLSEARDSAYGGESIARNLPPSVCNPVSGTDEKLVHVLVLCDGLNVNASHLVAGALAHLPPGVTMTGGLAGGGTLLDATLVFRDNVPAHNTIAALGFYGSRLKVGFGSLSGWDPFGPERLITKATGNVLYALDGQPALGLYKKYLGPQAKDLPASGLFFPLSIRTKQNSTPTIRACLSVDESAQSLIFTADIPEGGYARLMKANFDRLIEGAAGAARASCRHPDHADPDLAIVVTCVGRKLVLKQRTEEELEVVRDVLGERTVITGFYSHGEISPVAPGEPCQLNYQTLSLTTFTER